MPFYDKDLDKDSGDIPYQDLIQICRQLLSALVYLHEKGIVHADIKPSNILLDFSSTFHKYEINDDDFDGPLTTNGYVAPEVLRQRSFDEKIDIWALGVSILEIIHGTNPLLNQYAYEIPYILNSLTIRRTLSNFKTVGNLVKRMLTMNPRDRPSASECLASLDV